MLAFMLNPEETNKDPDVAPVGIVKITAEALHDAIVIGRPFNITTPLPCDAPKLEPTIPICAPTDPSVAERLLIDGTVIAEELTEALSNVAVVALLVEALLTARPT
jgi:hypothetical protein